VISAVILVGVLHSIAFSSVLNHNGVNQAAGVMVGVSIGQLELQ
jgi:hypothetical protein